MAGRWVDVAEAARVLEISTDAVRKRIARGSLRSDRPDGNVLVWLDDGGTEAGREAQVDREALVEVLSEQVAYLKEQLDIRTEELREHRRIIAALTQRIPELEPPREQEAPQEPPGGPQSAGSGAVREEAPPAGEGSQHGSERPRDTAEFPVRGGSLTRPWWRRVFGR
jgi:hypothetical protein